LVEAEILDHSPGVSWDDIQGLVLAKEALTEAVLLPSLRPDLYTGLTAPPKGVLLVGPPGTGKTLLAKALASASRATFFSVSAASLMSKWVGEGERLVRALFTVARRRQPAVIFLDEVDALLSTRSGGENDAARRLKTEFLVQMDGAGTSGDERVLVLAATNRPWDLDDALVRRLPKRILIPLPDDATRSALLRHCVRDVPTRLSDAQWRTVVTATDGYSGSDLKALAKEAAMVRVREVAHAGGLRAVLEVRREALRPVAVADFQAALRVIRASVPRASLRAFDEWNRTYGVSGT
jgi:spastin